MVFNEPVLEIVKFDTKDVIVTSEGGSYEYCKGSVSFSEEGCGSKATSVG